MSNRYTSERNAQILLSLLKQNGVKRIIASPGTTNIAVVASVQQDSFFEVYSAPDERSAAYMACGMAEETGEPVVISCTGATASRNYMPGMTEAYYRKLPVIAVTSSRQSFYIGNNDDQVTDRTALPNDVAKISVQLPIVRDSDSEWACVKRMNAAMHTLFAHGGGPIHIHLETKYDTDFSVSEIKNVRKIAYYKDGKKFPEIKASDVVVLVGSHGKWSEELLCLVDEFCEKYNGAVVCDHISNYSGKYKVLNALAASQYHYETEVTEAKLVIHIGGITSTGFKVSPQSLWRVNPDGVIRDPFKCVTALFETEEVDFFSYYCTVKKEKCKEMSFFSRLQQEENRLAGKVPELPFSNAWIASKYASIIPAQSVIHFGIRNSLRVWSYFSLHNSVRAYSNVGGFGIDGCLSSLIGAALCNKGKTYYGVVGDLAFFYDMNSLGNRHVSPNIRIILVNNATGMEMKFTGFYASKIGAEIDSFISASKHYGNQSVSLVRNYAESLGFRYFSANDKAEFEKNAKVFFSGDVTAQPYIFEVFVDSKDEDKAHQILTSIESTASGDLKNSIKKIIGEKNASYLKRALGKQ